jgi:uncharacterized ion transporter superfamily protein YfcC
MATESPAPQAPVAEPEKKGIKFPTAFTVLFFVLIIVWVLSFIIPPGAYDYVDCGDGTAVPVPGSYHEVEVETTWSGKLYDLWLAPVNGLYGQQGGQEAVESPVVASNEDIQSTCAAIVSELTGVPEEQLAESDYEANVVFLGNAQPIGPYESGDMIGAVQVFFFVLAIGAFITVTINTGALDVGIARLVYRFKTNSTVLIILLMIIFSLGGTSYGMAEETLGFYALIVPIMVALGYDRMTGAVVIMLGAGVGTLCSTVNPFATGVASDAAGIELGNGIVLRALMYLVLVPITILYVLRYAGRVKKDPSKSLSVRQEGDDLLAAETDTEPPEMSGGQKSVIWVFMLTFVLMIFSVIPWSDFSSSLENITLGWYFPELAALFLVGSVIIGLLGRLGEEGMVNSIVSGMGDFIGAAFIIALARGVTVVMNNASITDTVLNSLEGVVSGLTSGVFAMVMFVVNIPLAFLVPSSSGHATLAMPIMAPLADFADVSRAIVVTGFQSASGWVNLFTPTSAIVMGGLTLAKVGYDRYLRFVTPLLVVLFVLVCVFVFFGSATSIGGT